MRPQDRGSGQQEINRPHAQPTAIKPLFFLWGGRRKWPPPRRRGDPACPPSPARTAVRNVVQNWSEIQMTKGPEATVSRKHNRSELDARPHGVFCAAVSIVVSKD